MMRFIIAISCLSNQTVLTPVQENTSTTHLQIALARSHAQLHTAQEHNKLQLRILHAISTKLKLDWNVLTDLLSGLSEENVAKFNQATRALDDTNKTLLSDLVDSTRNAMKAEEKAHRAYTRMWQN